MKLEKQAVHIWVFCLVQITDSVHGMTALHIACKYASENVASLLIERLKVSQLTQPDNNRMMALHHVCKCKLEKPAVVKRMLKRLKQFLNEQSLIEMLSKKDRFENTLFDLAIKENHLNIVELLLNVNPMYKNISDHELNLPIHIATRFNGTLNTLELLERMFPLLLFICSIFFFNTKLFISEFIIERKFTFDFEGFECISFSANKNWDNVFHLAASTNKLDFIEELLNKYKSVKSLTWALNAYNSDRQTPLLCAIGKGHIKCVDYLIKKQVTMFFI